MVVLYGLAPLVTHRADRLPLRYRHVLFWGGLRGAVGVAATLSLPLDLPQRDQIQTLAYGAIVFTLLVQGLTIGPLVRLLGLQQRVPEGTVSTSSSEMSAATARLG
jgi:CPA1 family monovalent cation:H+ antiporter